MVRRGEIMKKLVLLLLVAVAAWGQPSGGIPPRPQRVLFANLGTPQASNWRYCTDCAATAPCTGSGSGAFAFRVGSTWNCNAGTPALATPVSVANGGTGIATATAFAPLFGGTTSTGAFQSVSLGTSGWVLTSNGAGALPTFQAAAAGGATIALDNLAATQVNADIIPGVSITRNLGSTTKAWAYVYLRNGAVGTSGVSGGGAALRFLSPSGGGFNGTYNGCGYVDAVGPYCYDDNANSGNGAALAWTYQGLTANRTITPFNGSGTMVLDTATQTLSGKSISLGSNTVTATSAQMRTAISDETGTGAAVFATSPSISDPTFSGHMVTSGTTPSVSSCGAGPAIVGNDNAGRVTVGTGVTTTCTLTFATAWTTAPVCHAENETTILLVQPVPTTTAVVLNSGSALTSNVIAYSCRGY